MNRFAKKMRVGIDIGSASIKCIGWHEHGGSPRYCFADQIALPCEQGATSKQEVAEEVKADVLRELAARNPLSQATITATIPADSAVVRCTKIQQPSDAAELISAIERELAASGGVPAREMQIRCQQLDLDDQGDGQVALLACSVPDEEVASRKRLFAEAEVKIAGMGVDVFGLYKTMISFGQTENDTATGMVHVGSRQTLCVLTQPGTAPFFNVINIAGSFLTQRIMLEYKMDLTVAERFKRKMFKPQWMRHPAFKTSLLQSPFDEFTGHLAKKLKGNFLHFQATRGANPVNKIYLTGGGARLGLLVPALEEKLQVEIATWDPFDSLAGSPEQKSDSIAFSAGVHFALAFGVTQGGNGS